MLAQAAEVDVIVTTALIPGRQAPVLVNQEMLDLLRPGSVLVDLAAANGGSVAQTVADEVITTDGGVTILGYTDLPSRLASTSSTLFGNNVAKFILSVGPQTTQEAGVFQIDLDDDVVQNMLVAYDGVARFPDRSQVDRDGGRAPRLYPRLLVAREPLNGAEQPRPRAPPAVLAVGRQALDLVVDRRGRGRPRPRAFRVPLLALSDPDAPDDRRRGAVRCDPKYPTLVREPLSYHEASALVEARALRGRGAQVRLQRGPDHFSYRGVVVVEVRVNAPVQALDLLVLPRGRDAADPDGGGVGALPLPWTEAVRPGVGVARGGGRRAHHSVAAQVQRQRRVLVERLPGPEEAGRARAAGAAAAPSDAVRTADTAKPRPARRSRTLRGSAPSGRSHGGAASGSTSAGAVAVPRRSRPRNRRA